MTHPLERLWQDGVRKKAERLSSTAAERMRYKVLHKFHDYKARFGQEHMCVGCGRCTHRCPEFISISATVNKVSAAVEEIRAALDR